MSSCTIFKFLLSALLGFGFFLLPVNYQGQTTVVFDLFVKLITKNFPTGVTFYCFGLILFGALSTLLSNSKKISDRLSFLSYYKSSTIYSLLRFSGLIIAVMMFFKIGPQFILDAKISKLMWNTLVFSVGVIIPIGAIFLNIFIRYGCIEFFGTFMRPLMRPLFKLPGRSSIDDLTSWLGSYSTGLYFTRIMLNQGYYTRRETFTIITCFCTVSIGFVGVVAFTLGIANLFPIIFLTYFFTVYLLAIVMVRIWPITSIYNTYVGISNPEPEFKGSFLSYFKFAWKQAIEKAEHAQSFPKTIMEGFLDGLKLATTILGCILIIGTLALLVYEYTPLFQYLGYPLVPIIKLLGIPDAEVVAPATLAGITEMYIPALMVKNASVPAKFFIAVLSISQIIFFSSIGPMMMDMFKDVPVKFHSLIILFLIRTALLIPFLAFVNFILTSIGIF